MSNKPDGFWTCPRLLTGFPGNPGLVVLLQLTARGPRRERRRVDVDVVVAGLAHDLAQRRRRLVARAALARRLARRCPEQRHEHVARLALLARVDVCGGRRTDLAELDREADRPLRRIDPQRRRAAA